MSFETSIYYTEYKKYEKSLNLARNQKAPNALLEKVKKIVKAPFVFVARWTLAIAFWSALIALIAAVVGHFGWWAIFLL